MNRVFVVHHEYEPGDGGPEEVKLIGVYSTRQIAEAAVGRLRLQPGFSSYPEGFTIDEYELDHDHWADGFFRPE